MPKREPTPPPADDEPNYFTILNPYPPNASMELEGDLVNLARWLAAATGNEDALMAVFHKPSSPRLVIIEVSKSYKDTRLLLGQHFWGGPKGILLEGLTPDNYSAIFFCHYTTGRQVEKHGWKREWFTGDMFADKKKPNKMFKNPYPVTTFLQVPSTDPTAVEFCRPLPLALFPEVGSSKAKPLNTVGSATWAVTKDLGPPNPDQKSTRSFKRDTASLSTPVEADAQDTLDSEPQNLWADSKGGMSIPLMSDLAVASGRNAQDREVCPYHGNLCKKMCEWRTAKEKKNGPKVGGPSNTKNYRPAGPSRGSKAQRPTINLARSAASYNASSPDPMNMSPVAASPSTPGRGAPNAKSSTHGRAPPPPPGLIRPVVSPLIAQNELEATPPVVTTVGRGVSTGSARGAPAWSSRGRGRGRA